MPFRSTEEEKAQKQAEREAKAKADQAEKAANAYAASPVGRAEAAYERGDTFFEARIEIDPSASESPRSGGSYGNSSSSLLYDAVSMAAKAVWERRQTNSAASLEADVCAETVESTDVLGDIERIGWHLENAGYVYVQTSSSSSGDVDGYNTTFSGKTVGIYLFRRVQEPLDLVD